MAAAAILKNTLPVEPHEKGKVRFLIGSYKPGVLFSYRWFNRKCIFQDGCRRHLGFQITATISLLVDQSSLYFLLEGCESNVERNCRVENANLPKFKMATAAILNFEKLLPFLHYWTNSHQVWWVGCESDTERNCNVEN